MTNNITQDIQLYYKETNNEVSLNSLKFKYINNDIIIDNLIDIKIDNLHYKVSPKLINESISSLEDIEFNINNNKLYEIHQSIQCDLSPTILKKIIIRWITLDEDIKKISFTLNELKKEKLQIETKILQYMKDNNKTEITTSEGKIKKKISETKESLNETYIRNNLTKLIDNTTIIDQLTSILLNNRNIKLNYKLSNNKY